MFWGCSSLTVLAMLPVPYAEQRLLAAAATATVITTIFASASINMVE